MTKDQQETRTAALQRENDALREEITEAKALLQSLRSASDSEIVTYLKKYKPKSIHRASALAGTSIARPNFSVSQLATSFELPADSQLCVELEVQNTRSYPMIVPFKDPQLVADTLVGPHSPIRFHSVLR